MTATIIDGKETAKEKREQLAKEVEELKAQGVVPGLAVILIGDDPASVSYVTGKKKAAETMGMKFKLDRFDSSLTEAELLTVIDQYNQNPEFHGILVQSPLPDHISEKAVIERISPDKDVDGFHPLNVGKIVAWRRYISSMHAARNCRVIEKDERRSFRQRSCCSRTKQYCR